MPVYAVKLVGRDKPQLVEATNAASAKNHVLKPLIETCAVAKTAEAIKMMRDGIELEAASGEG